jgi:hypothetical protein
MQVIKMAKVLELSILELPTTMKANLLMRLLNPVSFNRMMRMQRKMGLLFQAT